MTSGAQAALTPVGPVLLMDRLPPLHAELMSLLRGLEPADWNRPTSCSLWSVKDIAAHLLDTSLRRLSFGRDGLDPAPPVVITGYADLVSYLNRLNADWVSACKRLSPVVLMELLDFTASRVHAFLQSLDPHAPALFPVAWAGEDVSPNWFDIGREYTERWLHQQQIREAVAAPGLTGRPWLHPTLDIFVRALPHTFRHMEVAAGSSIRLDIQGDAGGVWTLVRSPAGWELFRGSDPAPAAEITLDQETAWKLFSKGLDPDSAARRIRIQGDRRLGETILGSLAIMA
jgi:uncharacterized protein (TIGR03083 family)